MSRSERIRHVTLNTPDDAPLTPHREDGAGLGISAAFARRLGQALGAAGYPARADPARINYPMVLLLLVILMVYVTMATGPMAAWLVELFPARIRYTSMSVPYHIGAGWFGGFMPVVAFTLVAITGDIYSGLGYLVIVTTLTVIAGVLFLPETAGRRA